MVIRAFLYQTEINVDSLIENGDNRAITNQVGTRMDGIKVAARRLNVNDIIEAPTSKGLVDAVVKSVFVNFDGAEFAKLTLESLDDGVALEWTGGVMDEFTKIGRVLKENCRSSTFAQSGLLI